jgi:predicted nucleic-acid-binding protein
VGPQKDAKVSVVEASVSAFVDTSVLVRHLTGDSPEVAARATDFLRAEDELLVVDLVVAETIYVLESFYEAPRASIAESLRSLMAMDSVIVVDGPLLLRAIDVYENDRIDFAEAYLVACAETTAVARVASFDRAIDRIATVVRVEP